MPLDLGQGKDLKEYLMGVGGMDENQALDVMEKMDIAGRTRCEMDMARRRAAIVTHQSAYDPYKQAYPDFTMKGGR